MSRYQDQALFGQTKSRKSRFFQACLRPPFVGWMSSLPEVKVLKDAAPKELKLQEKHCLFFLLSVTICTLCSAVSSTTLLAKNKINRPKKGFSPYIFKIVWVKLMKQKIRIFFFYQQQKDSPKKKWLLLGLLPNSYTYEFYQIHK